MSKVLSDIHISVILPVLNGAATLEAQLGSLAHQTYRGRWELIVADNGSSDKTREIAEGWRHRLRPMVVLDASGRPGPAAGRNAGARVARGDIFVFCDADDVASPGWLEACAAASDKYQFIAGGLDHYALNPFAPPWKQRVLLEPPKTPWGERFADSANMVISRTAFEAVAGFSEDMLRSADVDLAWRLEAAGYPLYFEPAALMAKRDRSTLRQVWRQSARWGAADVQLWKRHSADRTPSWRTALRRNLDFLVSDPRLAMALLHPSHYRSWVAAAGRVWDGYAPH